MPLAQCWHLTIVRQWSCCGLITFEAVWLWLLLLDIKDRSQQVWSSSEQGALLAYILECVCFGKILGKDLYQEVWCSDLEERVL